MSVIGYSLFDAAEKAINNIDFIRGLWNLYFNQKQYGRESYGPRQPFNRCILGPLHTLHFPSGKAATETFWYESSYRKPLKSHNIHAEWDEMLNFERYHRKLINKYPFKDKLELVIRRYCRALDEVDYDNAF